MWGSVKSLRGGGGVLTDHINQKDRLLHRVGWGVRACVSCNTFCSEAETNTGCDTTRLPLPRTCPRGFRPVQRAPSVGHQVSQQRCAGKIPLPQIRERLASEMILIRIHGILHLQESQSCVDGKRKKQEVRRMTDR